MKLQIIRGRVLMVLWLKCWIAASKYTSSNSSCPFRTNTLGKAMKPLIPPKYWLDITTVLLQGWL